jgi:hypothetical protein
MNSRKTLARLTQAHESKTKMHLKEWLAQVRRRLRRPLTKPETENEEERFKQDPSAKKASQLSPVERRQLIGTRSRYASEPYRKPYKQRDQIERTVARQFGVKQSFVQTCWKEYRELEAQMRAENYRPG